MDDTGPIDALFNCILYIKTWMAANFLQLNYDQTEVLDIDPEGHKEKLLPELQDFKPPQSVKIWVWFLTLRLVLFHTSKI